MQCCPKGSPEFTTTRPRTPQENQKSLPSQFGQNCDIKKARNSYLAFRIEFVVFQKVDSQIGIGSIQRKLLGPLRACGDWLLPLPTEPET